MNSRKKISGSIEFSDFLRHRANVFGLHAQSSLQDYQFCILRAQREFWEIFLVEICAPHSGISSDNRCRFFAQNFWVRLSNLNPKVSRWSYFRKKLVGIFINFFIFGLWAVTSQTFDTKIVNGLPKLPSTVSEILIRKIFLTRKNRPIGFWLWADDFRASGRKVRKVLYNCSLCVQRRFSKEQTFKLKSFFSNSLWIWADDFQDSGDKCRKHHQS